MNQRAMASPYTGRIQQGSSRDERTDHTRINKMRGTGKLANTSIVLKVNSR